MKKLRKTYSAKDFDNWEEGGKFYEKFKLEFGEKQVAVPEIIKWLECKEGWKQAVVLTKTLEMTKSFVAYGLSVQVGNDSALRFASQRGRADIVEFLIAQGADVHASHDFSICKASENGHKEVVEILLNHGADARANCDYAMRWALNNGHKEIVEILLNHGAVSPANADSSKKYSKSLMAI